MLPNWAVDDDRLNSYDLLVYMALIRHADNTGMCWPSLERIAKVARCTQPTVSKSLNTLERLRYVRRVKTDGKANRYHVSIWQPTPKPGYDPAPTPKPDFDPPKRGFDPPQNDVLTNKTQENKTQELHPRDENKLTVSCHSPETLAALVDLWPKKCRISDEFMRYFNQACDEVGAEVLLKAAKRFISSCEGTPMQYVRTLPVWLANAVNWRPQKADRRSEVELSNWMTKRLPDTKSGDVVTHIRARRAYWGVNGGVEALEREFFPSVSGEGVSKLSNQPDSDMFDISRDRA